MGNHQARKAVLRVEVMEERIALSTLPHHAALLAPAAVRPVARRSASIHLLTPQLTGTTITSATVNPRAGIVQIKGAIALPAGFAASNPSISAFPFSITVTQAFGRSRSVTGSGVAIVAVSPSSGSSKLPFQINLTASNGKFGRGFATVTLPDYSTGYSLNASWMVTLRR